MTDNLTNILDSMGCSVKRVEEVVGTNIENVVYGRDTITSCFNGYDPSNLKSRFHNFFSRGEYGASNSVEVERLIVANGDDLNFLTVGSEKRDIIIPKIIFMFSPNSEYNNGNPVVLKEGEIYVMPVIHTNRYELDGAEYEQFEIGVIDEGRIKVLKEESLKGRNSLSISPDDINALNENIAFITNDESLKSSTRVSDLLNKELNLARDSLNEESNFKRIDMTCPLLYYDCNLVNIV